MLASAASASSVISITIISSRKIGRPRGAAWSRCRLDRRHGERRQRESEPLSEDESRGQPGEGVRR